MFFILSLIIIIGLALNTAIYIRAIPFINKYGLSDTALYANKPLLAIYLTYPLIAIPGLFLDWKYAGLCIIITALAFTVNVIAIHEVSNFVRHSATRFILTALYALITSLNIILFFTFLAFSALSAGIAI